MTFICGVCGKVLKSRDNLRQHENRNKNVGKYTCETCGKASFSRANAEMHAASHKEKKPFSCVNCGKNLPVKFILTDTFKRKWVLEKSLLAVVRVTRNLTKRVTFKIIYRRIHKQRDIGAQNVRSCSGTVQVFRDIEHQSTPNKKK